MALLFTALCLAFLPACSSTPELTPPRVLLSPYDTSHGDLVWAVVPLRNESGTSAADPQRISDRVVAAAAEVRGVRALPLNRTLAAMRQLEMAELRTPADARRLAQHLGADGLIVGSITDYDPYTPTLGLALAVYAPSEAMSRRGASSLDVSALRYQPTDYQYFKQSQPVGRDESASAVAEHLDGKNHQVLLDIQSYAAGRHDPVSALGWRRYTASMEQFEEFAAWHTMGRLLDQEWVRLERARVERRPAPGSAPPRSERRTAGAR